MKKTTYIMLGAMVGGFIAVLSLSRWYLSHTDTISYAIDGPDTGLTSLGGDVTKIPLDRFEAIRFGDDDGGARIANYKGMAVCQSDTATRPWLMTRRDWAPLLQTSVTDGTLDVTLNRHGIEDLYGKKVRTEDYIIATVIIPQQRLATVSTKDHTLYLDSIRTAQLAVNAPDRLVLNVCRIDTLNNTAGSLNELKLDASAITDASLRGVSKKFTVTCTTPQSEINTLRIDGVTSGDKVKINCRDANIGSLIWNPEDMTTDVRLETSSPINFVRKR